MQGWKHFVPCKDRFALGEALDRFRPNSLGGKEKPLKKNTQLVLGLPHGLWL